MSRQLLLAIVLAAGCLPKVEIVEPSEGGGAEPASTSGAGGTAGGSDTSGGTAGGSAGTDATTSSSGGAVGTGGESSTSAGGAGGAGLGGSSAIGGNGGINGGGGTGGSSGTGASGGAGQGGSGGVGGASSGTAGATGGNGGRTGGAGGNAGAAGASGRAGAGGTSVTSGGAGGASAGSSGMGGSGTGGGNPCVATSGSAWADWPMPNPPSGGLPNAQSYDTSTPGVVRDNVTGLVWQRALDDARLAQTAAQTYCAGRVLGGCNQWRLPTRIELVSIVDYSRRAPAIDGTAFPDAAQESFWTSSTQAGESSVGWRVDFTDGSVLDGDAHAGLRVRCVH